MPPTAGFPASSHQVVKQKHKPPAHKAPAVSHALLLFRALWGKHGATRKVSAVSAIHPRARSLVQGPGMPRGTCESVLRETQTFLGKGLTASAGPSEGRHPEAPAGRRSGQNHRSSTSSARHPNLRPHHTPAPLLGRGLPERQLHLIPDPFTRVVLDGFFFFFLATLCSLQNLSFPTRD